MTKEEETLKKLTFAVILIMSTEVSWADSRGSEFIRFKVSETNCISIIRAMRSDCEHSQTFIEFCRLENFKTNI
jgi:hypothetical protein